MKDRTVRVHINEKVNDGIYKMVLESSDFKRIKGGQFVHIALPHSEKPLRRPFCIADFCEKTKMITVYYAVVGGGTECLARVKSGDKLAAAFPLGNGIVFNAGDRVMLIGGGMGAAVLPSVTTASPKAEFYTYLGFLNKNKAILIDELRHKSRSLVVATDDGSLGREGYVTDVARDALDIICPNAILICGPSAMLKACKKLFADVKIPVYVSLESRMGCGIGACLVCNCRAKRNGGDVMLRVCADGPIFKLDEVEL